jgi:hypothetical protein
MEPMNKLVPARSLASAEVGQVLYIDRTGDVLGPGRLRTRAAAVGLAAGGIAATGGLLYGFMFGPAAGIGLTAAIAALVFWRSRHLRPFRAAVALLAAGQRDEGYAALLALESKSLSPRLRDAVAARLAAAAWLRGALDEAAQRYDRLLPRLARGRKATEYWLCGFQRAQLAAAQGDLERARRMQDELRSAPRGQIFELMEQSLALTVAFYADTPAVLPDDETLHGWVRAALGRTRFGGMLVTLSWAFHRRGDAGLAAHLLAEAPARLEGAFLADTFPKVQAWLDEHAEQTDGA